MMNSQRIMGGVPSGNSTSSTLYNRGLDMIDVSVSGPGIVL